MTQDVQFGGRMLGGLGREPANALMNAAPASG